MRHKFGSGLAFLAAVLAAGGAWICAIGHWWPAESVEGLVRISGPAGDRIFVTESVSHDMGDSSFDRYTTRLAVYDLASGERVSRRVLAWLREGSPSLTWLGPGPAGAFFHDSSDGVQLLDRSDGSVLRGPSDLLPGGLRERVLRSGPLEKRLGALPAAEAIVVTLNDGTRVRVDGVVPPTPYTGEQPALPVNRRPGSAKPLPLGGGRHARLKQLDGDPIDSARLRTPGHQSSTPLLSAIFLTSSAGDPILLEGPEGTLLVHAASLETDADTLLSRVSFETGDPVWSVPLGTRPQLHLAWRIDDAIVLVFWVEGDTVVASYALEDGAERYRRELD